MPDVVDSATRSRMMSGIRGKHTRPELQIRRGLHRLGFRFRLHVSSLPGKPDIVLPRYHAIVQVHGCFWHGHDCHLFKLPSTKRDWWTSKIQRTRTLDEETTEALLASGWRVAIVWECALKGKERIGEDEIMTLLTDWIRDESSPILTIRGRRPATKAY
jgi:DNA mismatch endonuclease (patch repair protein)